MPHFLFRGLLDSAQHLQESGFDFTHVEDDADALKCLEQMHFSFILLDARDPNLQQSMATLTQPLPMLVLAASPFESELYQQFVSRRIFDLVDPEGLPASLQKSLILLFSGSQVKPSPEAVPAQALNRLKNKLLSQLYHQLQGPVTALDGYLEILRSDQLSPENIAQIFDQLGQCVVRLRLFFHTLHLLSLIDAEKLNLNPRPFQFHQLIREFQRDFQEQMALSESVWDYQLDAQNELVWADPHFLLHLFSALMNLIQRAGLAKGRTVSLQTSNVSGERLLRRSEMPLEPEQALVSFLPAEPAAQYLQVTLQIRGNNPDLIACLMRNRKGDLMTGDIEAETALGVYLIEKILQASSSWLYTEVQAGFGLLLSFVLPIHSLASV